MSFLDDDGGDFNGGMDSFSSAPGLSAFSNAMGGNNRNRVGSLTSLASSAGVSAQPTPGRQPAPAAAFTIAPATQAALAQAKPLIAAVVDAFNFVGDQYQAQGKAGISLLGVASTKQCFLIVYKPQDKRPIGLVTVTDKCRFILRKDSNYATFYDDSGCNWAVHFDSADSLASFCLQLLIAKSVQPGSVEKFPVVQDALLVTTSDQQAIAESFRVEANYSAYQLNLADWKLAPAPFEAAQKHRFKSGVNEGGLGQVVIGMTSGSRRFGALPAGNGVIVVYDVTVLRTKAPSADKVSVQQPTSESDLTAEAPGPGRRTGLLSRMARLGHQVLPPPGGASAETLVEQPLEYDNGYEATSLDTVAPPRPTRPQIPTPLAGMAVPQPSGNAVAIYQRPVTSVTPPATAAAEIQHSTPVSQQQSSERPEWTVLFMESRQSSSEMRLAMSKLQDKLESLSDRVEKQNQLLAISNNSSDVAGGTLDGKTVLAALHKMVAEEQRLRDELKTRQDKIEDLNQRVTSLLTDKQKLIENTNQALSERSDAMSNATAHSAGKVLQLEEEKAALALRLSTLTAEVTDLHLLVADKRRTENDLRQEVARLLESLADSTKRAESAVQASSTAVQDVAAAQEIASKAEAEMAVQRSHVESLRSQLADSDRRLQQATAALAAKDASAADALMRASEEQSSMATKIRSLESELARVHQDLATSRASADRLSHELSAKMNEVREASIDRDRSIANKDVESRELQSKLRQLTEKIGEAEAALDESESVRQEQESKLSRMENQLEALRVQSSNGDIESLINGRVKSIMNQVFQATKSQIDPEEQFEGANVLKILLAAIKETTLRNLNPVTSKAPESRIAPPPSEPTGSVTPVSQPADDGSSLSPPELVQPERISQESMIVPKQADMIIPEDSGENVAVQEEEYDEPEMIETPPDPPTIEVNGDVQSEDDKEENSAEEPPVAPVHVDLVVSEASQEQNMASEDELLAPPRVADTDDDKTDAESFHSTNEDDQSERQSTPSIVPPVPAPAEIDTIDHAVVSDETAERAVHTPEVSPPTPPEIPDQSTEDDKAEEVEQVDDPLLGFGGERTNGSETASKRASSTASNASPKPSTTNGLVATQPPPTLPVVASTPPRKNSSLFGGNDSDDSDMEGLFASKPPPPAVQAEVAASTPVETADQEGDEEPDEPPAPKHQPKQQSLPPPPQNRSGGLFGDDDDDEDLEDWFGGAKK